MIYISFFFWVASAIVIVLERRPIRLLIYSGVFGVVTSLIYLLMAAPDLAMAEIAISAFSTVFLIICLEKFFVTGADKDAAKNRKKRVTTPTGYILPLLFTLGVLGLFIAFIPDVTINTYLAEQFVAGFNADVGGLNAITSIYLGYRMYDTMYEALMLVVVVVAVSHLSFYGREYVAEGMKSEVKTSKAAILTLQILAPLILLFGVYVITNGHMGPGGGFQGGLLIAAFFVCRYMIHDIYDMPIKKILKFEEYTFISIIVFSVLLVFSGIVIGLPIYTGSPLFQGFHLVLLNSLIGIKVACGFIVLFYRYVAIERR